MIFDSKECRSQEFWDDNKVIEFTNWYLDVLKFPFRYKIENQTILDSFKRGDSPKEWHKNPFEDFWKKKLSDRIGK